MLTRRNTKSQLTTKDSLKFTGTLLPIRVENLKEDQEIKASSISPKCGATYSPFFKSKGETDRSSTSAQTPKDSPTSSPIPPFKLDRIPVMIQKSTSVSSFFGKKGKASDKIAITGDHSPLSATSAAASFKNPLSAELLKHQEIVKNVIQSAREVLPKSRGDSNQLTKDQSPLHIQDSGLFSRRHTFRNSLTRDKTPLNSQTPDGGMKPQLRNSLFVKAFDHPKQEAPLDCSSEEVEDSLEIIEPSARYPYARSPSIQEKVYFQLKGFMERRKQSIDLVNHREALLHQEDSPNTLKMPILKRQSLAGNALLGLKEDKDANLEGLSRNFDRDLFATDRRNKSEHPWFIKTKLKRQTLKRFDSINPYNEYKLKVQAQK